MESKENLRDIVLSGLLSLEKEEIHSHIVIRGILEKYDYLPSAEKGFIKRVLEGTIEQQIRIDYVLDRFSKVPVKKMKPLIRMLLRMSVYQILFMDAIPDSAVCNEAVRLANAHHFGSLKGFVNGVLRSIVRGKDTIEYPDKKANPIAYYSVLYSMPQRLVRMWTESYGPDRTEKILRSFLEEKPVSVRLSGSLSKDGQDAVLKELSDAGITVEESEILPNAFLLRKVEGLRSIDAFERGLFTVQDVSSMLAVLAAGIKEGDFVIDTCAAPGGKTFYAAELAGSAGRILSCDVSERKVVLLEETKERLHADTVTCRVWDATVLDETLTETADVVIADVPCSGLGVIGKKQDIKYRIDPDDLKSLISLQRQILENVSRYVKKGGVLLFSTCTINREENEEAVSWLLDHFPFHADDLTPYIPTGSGAWQSAIEAEDLRKGFLQLLPGIHGTDGFFIARLIKD
ncbi:MAG: 16S rRNA (cytosine(967)-C(5))-methyltransferase RsmB [Lachnospiraceae bacterium]|nr:16S rRNA (cytosine(967)-C(5))-methyltransferase RsmB [Lachnospiraceae bacterium]